MSPALHLASALLMTAKTEYPLLKVISPDEATPQSPPPATPELLAELKQASDRLEFESAAIYRDRIRALTQIQAHQDINVAGLDDADVIAAHQTAGQTCVQVFFFRAGQNFGNRTYFPRHAAELDVVEVLGPFLGQFYADKEPPRQVLVSHLPENSDLVAAALAVRAGRRVVLARPARGTKRKLVDHALANAREAMARRPLAV